MTYSRLHIPDDDNERRESQYSPDVGNAIAQAYVAVRRGDIATAEMRILPWLSAEMAPMQRVRLLYIRGLIAGHRDHYTDVLQYADEALDTALDIEQLDAVTTLAILGAAAQHNLQLFAGSARYYTVALDAIKARKPGAESDPLTHFDVLDGLASELFLCGRYVSSRRVLHAASRITLPSHGHEKRLAGLEWTTALLARWQGDRYRALEHATAAMRTYAEQGHPIERARLNSLLADIFLDLVLPLPSLISLPPENYASGAGHLLELAQHHLLEALGTSVAEQDRAGEGLALLAYARFLRAYDRPGEAFRAIDTVESYALQLHDVPLQAQAFTARGEALAEQGDREAARACFTTTLDILRHSDTRAYTTRARRVLLQAAESDVDEP